MNEVPGGRTAGPRSGCSRSSSPHASSATSISRARSGG